MVHGAQEKQAMEPFTVHPVAMLAILAATLFFILYAITSD